MTVKTPSLLSFQSTLSMRRATESFDERVVFANISIHALHEESDKRNAVRDDRSERFQSTLSMRRATRMQFPSTQYNALFQSTLSMRRATLLGIRVIPHIIISIHALHEESDPRKLTATHSHRFQSTLSMRRATRTVRLMRWRFHFNPRSP